MSSNNREEDRELNTHHTGNVSCLLRGEIILADLNDKRTTTRIDMIQIYVLQADIVIYAAVYSTGTPCAIVPSVSIFIEIPIYSL